MSAIEVAPQYLASPLQVESIPEGLGYESPGIEQVDTRLEALGQRQNIRTVNLNRNLGTMILGLDRKVVHKVLSESQMADLTKFGFEPKPYPHITVLSYSSGRMVMKAVGGRGRKLSAVRKEARSIDWSWRSTGLFVPFQGRQGRLKLVNIIECPGIEEFQQRLEDNLPGLELERHPPHVTLMKGPHELKQRNIIIGGVAIGKPLNTLDHLRPVAAEQWRQD